jgi:hypothetical protein
MDVREMNMKERILIMRMEYSVLNEVLKFHACGWSDIGR